MASNGLKETFVTETRKRFVQVLFYWLSVYHIVYVSFTAIFLCMRAVGVIKVMTGTREQWADICEKFSESRTEKSL